MTYAIEATALTKRFGKTQALAGVDLAVREGTVLGVLGPNGAGETTAVRILATLLKADSGSARIGGFDVAHDAEKVRQLIGLTGQYASVDEDLTGTQNLVLIGQLLDLRTNEARRRAAELLQWFDLSAATDRRPRRAICAKRCISTSSRATSSRYPLGICMTRLASPRPRRSRETSDWRALAGSSGGSGPHNASTKAAGETGCGTSTASLTRSPGSRAPAMSTARSAPASPA
jgi:ABC-type uncharacterized transport system YnjBCD ATPase subunit